MKNVSQEFGRRPKLTVDEGRRFGREVEWDENVLINGVLKFLRYSTQHQLHGFIRTSQGRMFVSQCLDQCHQAVRLVGGTWVVRCFDNLEKNQMGVRSFKYLSCENISTSVTKGTTLSSMVFEMTSRLLSLDPRSYWTRI